MRIDTNFTNCCKAAVLFDFPYDYYGHRHTVESLEKDIKEEISAFIDVEDGYYAVMFATLNDTQAKAREALENLGFYGLPSPARNATGREIWSFMLPLNEWSHK